MTNSVPDDDAFDAMADEERRALLGRLRNGGPLRVSTLTDTSRELAAANDAFLDQYLSGTLDIHGIDEERIRTHCVHLPKLVEYDFVNWDRSTNFVTRGPRFDEVEPLLELVADRQSASTPMEPIVSQR